LTDARLQVHHAAQFATALAISYLKPRDDDSHTNLQWTDSLGALVSNAVKLDSSTVRVGLRIADLSLLVVDAKGRAVATRPLTGHTIADAQKWLGGELQLAGLDPARLTLKRHFEIPPHAVAKGAPFDTAHAAQFVQLAHWFSNGASVLGELAAATSGASEVRCWPHHFDVATLITLGPGKSIGAGLEPGDGYYDEPYFYVKASPEPPREKLASPLEGGGSWHTKEWAGAVLPGSRFAGDDVAQALQARKFLDSAVAACRRLLTS
jgi:hypothetical protein